MGLHKLSQHNNHYCIGQKNKRSNLFLIFFLGLNSALSVIVGIDAKKTYLAAEKSKYTVGNNHPKNKAFLRQIFDEWTIPAILVKQSRYHARNIDTFLIFVILEL